MKRSNPIHRAAAGALVLVAILGYILTLLVAGMKRSNPIPRAAAGALVLVAILGYILTLLVAYW